MKVGYSSLSAFGVAEVRDFLSVVDVKRYSETLKKTLTWIHELFEM